MSGRGDPGSVPGLRDPRVFVSRSGELGPAREPLHRDPDAGIGPGMSFAMRLVADGACDRVVLVPCAVGGTWIERWVPEADLFARSVKEAKAAAVHGSTAGILWHQGEANAASPAAADSYADQLRSVVTGLRNRLDAPELPFIAGEIGRFLDGYPGCPEHARINQVIHEVCRDLPFCSVVSSNGLGHTGDYLHFDAVAARTLGIRYADAWIEMTRPIKL